MCNNHGKGHFELDDTFKCVNVVVKPVRGCSDHNTTAKYYGILKPGRGKIDVCLKYHSTKQINLPKWTSVGEIAAVHVIPALLAPKPTEDKSGKGEATTGKRNGGSQKEYLDKIDLMGLRDWSQNKQKEAQEFITEYTSIFALSDMDLGRTSLVKHSITLMDNTQFKEHY